MDGRPERPQGVGALRAWHARHRKADPLARSKFSCATLPGGWLVIYSNEFGYASPKRIAALSPGTLAIGCTIEEHVMFSGLRACADGSEVWSVTHDADDGIYDLRTNGELPGAFAAIRDRLLEQQDQAGGSNAEVDYVFEIPIELAASLSRATGTEG
jgi:hypothetical protein